ncbi:MAG: hypothetical protein H6P95_134 [Candidatus Aminicenantes bacterium]|jgi:hypothetical protein|nr:hypothetical protein [Candidatus Aminicenantes bacterium]
MSPSLADLFRREPDPEAFRRAVVALGGDFPFASADMIELGAAYFERYPDRAQDRNTAEVRIGYAAARVAIIEKAVLAVDPARRDAYRTMLDDVAKVGPSLQALLASCGRTALQADHQALSDALAALKAAIDEIPKGLIKERFVGGISNIFNIMYVIGMKLRGPLL